MRIIAGSAGRMAIKVPHDVARPTTDFVRQAMFSILGERIIDARMADLFAGSGALGLEALSRGACSCVFVDESHQATKVIRQNLETTRLSGGRVIQSEVLSFLKKDQQRYDLIFADPPYRVWKKTVCFMPRSPKPPPLRNIPTGNSWTGVITAARRSCFFRRRNWRSSLSCCIVA
jgi:16S rRNA (guanine(966)-N(2))-methyltransferase RsmD